MNQSSSPLFRKFMIVLASIVCVFYLAYRARFTFNLSTPYAIFASVFLYVGELFGIINLLLYFLQVWDVSEPGAQPVLEGRTVDVLVPTFNEDLSLLRATLEACVRMDYPHKTYVLDDGSRTDVESLAKELGVIYITRSNNLHAKAGNLNNALEQTDGEFVIVLDADHVPEPQFITRVIGYFHDEGLAYVQTPHAFYNFDSFQARLDHSNRRYWEEGDLFYRVIQPGRNHWNAPIFAGSAAMFRRSALKEIGYIATETVTEDMHTGLRLHEQGWRSLAVSERLIAGQAPPDITTFHKQRQRWAEGNLGIMKYDNPLTVRGLTMAQRLCYFGSMIHWASGIFKLAIYLTPILMLFSGVPPVREFTWPLALVTLTYLFTSLYTMKVVSNGYGSIVNSELFAMVNFWTQIKGTFRAILFRRKEFGVTAKGRNLAKDQMKQRSVWPFVRPQTWIIILSVLAVFWGWMKLRLELNPIRFASNHWRWLAQQVDGLVINNSIPAGFGISDDYFKPVVPTIWVLIIFWLAYKVTQRAFWPADRRLTTRHVVHLPVEYEIVVEQATTIRYGVTVDLNDTGMALIGYDDLPKGAILRFTIRGGGEIVKCKGEIRSVESLVRNGSADGYRYGIQFQNLTPPQIDAINRICLHYAVPRMFDEYTRGNRDTVWHRVKGWQGRSFAQRRNAKRNSFNLPLIVNSGSTEETTQYSATEDISRIAAAAMFENELPVGTQVGYLMPTPLGEVRGTGEVVRSDPQQVAGRTYYRTVMEFKEFESQGRTTLQSLVNLSNAGGMGSVLKPDKRSMLPNMRIPIIVAICIAVPLIFIQTAFFPFVNSEDYALRRMHELGRRDGGSEPTAMSAQQVAEFDAIHRDTMGQSYPSNDRLVNEMAVLIDNYPNYPPDIDAKRRAMIDQVAIKLAPRAEEDNSLQKTLLYAYHHNERWADAEKVFAHLTTLHQRGKLPDSDWYEVRWEAARIAVDAGKDREASQLYDGLVKDTPGLLTLLNEYAGMLVKFNRYEEAERVYQGVTPDRVARKLLFDINLNKMARYTDGKKQDAAAEEAKFQLAELRKPLPGTISLTPEQMLETDRMEANFYATKKDFTRTKEILEKIRLQYPNDTETIVKIAQMEMGLQRPEEALKTVELLLKDNVYTVESIKVFIDGASAIKTLDPVKGEKTTEGKLDLTEQRYAKTIFDEQRSKLRGDPTYLTRLSGVLLRSTSDALEDSKKALGEAYSDLLEKKTETSSELRKEIAGFMMRQGQWEQATEVLAGINTYDSRKLRNDLMLRAGNYDKALTDARDMERVFAVVDDQRIEIQKRIANIFVADRKFDEALQEYRKIKDQKLPEAVSQSIDVQIAKIYLYKAIPPNQPGYDQKQYNLALNEIEKVLDTPEKLKANGPEVWEEFVNAASGASEISKKQSEIIGTLADQASTSFGGKPETLSRLAWVLLKTNDTVKANLVLDKAMKLIDEKPKKLEPMTEEARKARETMLRELSGVLAQAERNREAASLVKDFVKTDEDHLALAKLYSGGRLWEDALAEVKGILLRKPDFKEAEVLQADIISWMHDLPKALEEFERLIRKYPDDLSLPVRHAEVLLWSKAYPQALSEFLGLYERQPNNPEVWSGLTATVSAIAGPGDQKVPANAVNAMQTVADRVLASSTQDGLLLARTALVMSFMKSPKATLLVDRALKLNSKDVITRVELASALASLRRYKEAIAQYKDLTLKADTRLQLINIATAAENLDLAAEQARLMVQDSADHKGDKKKLQSYLVARRILAEVLSWKGDFAESLAIYRDLLALDFEPSQIKLMMAEATVWWRKYPEGLFSFSELVDTKLEQPRIWKGFINAASSSPQMSASQEKQILMIDDKIGNDIQQPEMLSRLAWVLIRQQHAGRADRHIKKAVELLTKDPGEAAVRKEVAGVIVARLFPNQVIVKEPGRDLLTSRWLVEEGIILFKSLDEKTDFDTKTRIEFITLLLRSLDQKLPLDLMPSDFTQEVRQTLDLVERLLVPLLLKPPREDYAIRIRFGELLMYAAKFDLSKASYRRAQVEFALLIQEINDPANLSQQLAEVRLAQSYLWSGEISKALPMFEHILKDYILTGKNDTLIRDTWMGYIDSIAGMIGEKFKVVKSEEDIDRIRANLLTERQKEYILWAYQRAGKIAPNPSLKDIDPEEYERDVEYYTRSLARLGVALAYINEMPKSREVYSKAISLNTKRETTVRMWREYAEVLRHLKAYQEAEAIYQRLIAEQQRSVGSR